MIGAAHVRDTVRYSSGPFELIEYDLEQAVDRDSRAATTRCGPAVNSTRRSMSAGMPSDHPLRVAVIPHARAPRWSRAVINALRETQGLDLDIQSSIHPHSVPRHARDALSQSNGAILNPQLCDAVVDLAGAAT